MSEIKQTGFYSKDDLRSENRELALKMFFRELKALSFPSHGMSGCAVEYKTLDERLRDLISRWGLAEEEIGTRVSLAIEFPPGVVRNQWFYGLDGRPYSMKHNGIPPKKPAIKKKKSSR